MNHIISFWMMTFFFESLVNSCINFKFGLPPPLVGWSHIAIIFVGRPQPSFSNCFSFMFERWPNVDFSISIRWQVTTSPLSSKMLHFPHSTRIVSHRWKIEIKKNIVLMHSVVDLMLNIGFNVSLNCYTMKQRKESKKSSD